MAGFPRHYPDGKAASLFLDLLQRDIWSFCRLWQGSTVPHPAYTNALLTLTVRASLAVPRKNQTASAEPSWGRQRASPVELAGTDR
jgi:hypothetical protein